MAVRALIVSAAALALWAPAAHALPGPAGEGDAAVAQYGYSATETPPEPETLAPTTVVPPGGEVLGETITSTAGDGSRVVRETASGSAPVTERGSGGGAGIPSLPFTGLNVLVGVLAGCLLVAGGAAMRRAGRATAA